MKRVLIVLALVSASVLTACGGETGNVLNPNIQQARSFERQAKAQEDAVKAELRTAIALERIAKAFEEYLGKK